MFLNYNPKGLTPPPEQILHQISLLRKEFMERLSCCLKIEKPLPNDEEPERVCFFTYQDLKKATRNFDHKLGDGGYGEVYKGKLRDKRTVAVKVLKLRTQKSLDQFNNEVQLLSRLRHPNLVAFYGCTKPPKELLLIYEFVPNHTLKYHLHDQRLPFVWPLRIQIASEIAEGLSYLRSTTTPIIHRDVKSDSVLLDHAFRVKVADFGLCRLLPADETDVTTLTASTAGYEDPEYKRRLKFTLKSDVYSFGVVLVELLSRKKAVDIYRGDGNIFLDEIAPDMIMNQGMDRLVDPDIGYYSHADVGRIIDSVAQLALKCLQQTGDMRPSMIEVLRVLKEINEEMQHLTVFTEMINEMHQIQEAHQQVIAHIYTYKELKKATNSLEVILGKGGFGSTYFGKFRDGQTVVVKVQFRVNSKQDELFSNWANTLYRYRHPNLVAFLGCTNPHDNDRLLLVYEYVPNGTLFDHLHREHPSLDWNVRIKIATETAEALAFVHSVRPLIVHGDVKTSNILLDDAFHVKVAGLGEGDLSPWDTAGDSTVGRGTLGYLDPEYRRTLRLTDKSDVYSFGVVLLELISGQRVVDFKRDEEMIFLVPLGLDMIQNNKLDELVDPKLGYHCDDDVRRMIDSVAVLACKCLEPLSNVRPTMVNVLKNLKGIKERHNWDGLVED